MTRRSALPLPWSLVVLHHPIINNALELYIKRDLSFLLLLLAVVAVPSEAASIECHYVQFDRKLILICLFVALSGFISKEIFLYSIHFENFFIVSYAYH